VGGVARRSTAVQKERETSTYVLLLDAGNTLIGDRVLARDSKGKIVVEAMNLMAYDAMALGEQDLQLGPSELRERMAEATFPFLSANVDLAGELFAQPYVIKEMGGHQVAIVGLTGPAADELHGFHIRDPLQTVRDLVPQLHPVADIIILLTHVGQAIEEQMQQDIAGIDLIVGGATQGRTSTAVWDETTGVLILPSEQASRGHTGRLLGMASLNFDSAGRLASHSSGMISLTPEFADDPDQVALIQRYQQQIK